MDSAYRRTRRGTQFYSRLKNKFTGSEIPFLDVKTIWKTHTQATVEIAEEDLSVSLRVNASGITECSSPGKYYQHYRGLLVGTETSRYELAI